MVPEKRTSAATMNKWLSTLKSVENESEASFGFYANQGDEQETQYVIIVSQVRSVIVLVF